MKTLLAGLLSAAVLASPAALAKKDDPDKALPPGLQKKVERGGELPPGWKKKLQPGAVIEDDVYNAGKVVRETETYEDLQVEDKVIRVIKDSRRIAEILGAD